MGLIYSVAVQCLIGFVETTYIEYLEGTVLFLRSWSLCLRTNASEI